MAFHEQPKLDWTAALESIVDSSEDEGDDWNVRGLVCPEVISFTDPIEIK